MTTLIPIYMSTYLRRFTYLLLLSPDKRRHTTNQAATWDHLFKSQPYQNEVSWSIPEMLTKIKPVTASSMSHTCKPPPEPPPKGWLLIESIKLCWSTASNFEGATPSPKSRLLSSQEFIQPTSSKFGLVFESSIIGPKIIKHKTVDTPAIGVH